MIRYIVFDTFIKGSARLCAISPRKSVLFNAGKRGATLFATEATAQDAIERTVAWAATHIVGVPAWKAGDYVVAAVDVRTPRKKARR